MTQKQFDAAVIGNVGIDTNVYFNTPEVNFEVESNFTENIDYLGQAGGYASRGFAQLGYKTAFIGYVGNDVLGRYILDEFRKDGINTQAVFIDPAGTSRSINFMYADGRRKNFYDGKSHMNLKPDIDTCRRVLEQSRMAHFNIPNWARYLLPIAVELGLIISCDIQDVADISDPYRADFIESAHVIFMSAVNLSDPRTKMQQMVRKFPDKIFICGMGAKGCMVATEENTEHFIAVHLPGKVIDTNGAGDGLAVGFLSGYFFENAGLRESVLCAQIVARYTCTQKANTSELITKDILNKFLKGQNV